MNNSNAPATEPEDPGKLGAGPTQTLLLKGIVPYGKYGDLFLSFVAPAAKLSVDPPEIRVVLEIFLQTRNGVPSNSLNEMREAARQLGLEVELKETPKEVHSP